MKYRKFNVEPTNSNASSTAVRIINKSNKINKVFIDEEHACKWIDAFWYDRLADNLANAPEHIIQKELYDIGLSSETFL